MANVFKVTYIKVIFMITTYEISQSLHILIRLYFFCPRFRSSHRRYSIKTGVLTNFTKFAGNTYVEVPFFNKAAGLHAYNFIKKETSPQMLSC